MWQYKISNGELTHDGEFVGTGYSGFDSARNDAGSVSIVNRGPIPPGNWLLSAPYHDDKRGVNSFRLSPCAGTETFGRSGFLVHGDNATHTASEGCIILGPTIRERMAMLPDRNLTVIE